RRSSAARITEPGPDGVRDGIGGRHPRDGRGPLARRHDGSDSSAEQRMTHQASIAFTTSGHGDMHDVTSRVQEIVAKSRIATGIAHVFAVGSTAAVGAIEF